ncbi:MAG: hypothetical protein CBD74_09455 [Saprospirales bacterium TMED214]|nr:MAG: hypothetical protein CBD74_09455 [Saprospirales bacterium TMED214]
MQTPFKSFQKQAFLIVLGCWLMAPLGNAPCRAAEPNEAGKSGTTPVDTWLAKRGALILDDHGSLQRGGKTIARFPGAVKARASAGLWTRSKDQNAWRSTWKPGMGHTPVASYQGIDVNDLIVEVTFRYGEMTEPWHHQCFRIAVDNRPEVTGHVVSAWANPNNDFIEQGFLLQHIRKQKDKTIIEDLLLDQQSLQVQAHQWYTAVLEVVNDEALFRMGPHVAYAKAAQIGMPKNLVSLTLGTTWHEIKRVRIWKATANPSWPSRKDKSLESRKEFTPHIHDYNRDNVSPR